MIPSSKNQNPREGIETRRGSILSNPSHIQLQKTKIPARGLKLATRQPMTEIIQTTSKNQNPREGIETLRGRTTPLGSRRFLYRLQKTKIPARGLKHCGNVVALCASD